MVKPKPLIIYVVSVLMFAATAGRGFLQAFERNDPSRWIIAGLLVIYGILLFTDTIIVRFVPSYLIGYFIIQSIFVVALLLVPLYPPPPDIPKDNDFFALLFIPLCAQAIVYFPRPTRYYWVALLIVTSVLALLYQYGMSAGIKFAVTYILAYTMICFLAIFYINSEDAKNELNVANQKLQEYARNAEALAVVEERNRLARDLHDSVTQSLYSLTLFAEAASEELDSGNIETTKSHLKDLRDTSRQALQEMRLMVFELRPPELETKGFMLALQERLEAVEARTGIETVIDINNEKHLPAKIELGLYSIAREALNNILKHSHATKMKITLQRKNGSVILEIQDNGIGLNALEDGNSAGLGLKGMKERADQIGANLVLQNVPESGTLLRVEVPDDGND